jgi:hypothetical protein
MIYYSLIYLISKIKLIKYQLEPLVRHILNKNFKILIISGQN